MSEMPDKMSREERLATKLRENLRRRKAQSRAMEGRTADEADPGPSKQALSKEPRNS